MNTTTNTYILPVGDDDDKRLTFQNKTLQQVTHDHIYRSGLSSNDVVADVGCGNGEMTCWFLGQVAKIYAIDMSDEQLNLTKKKIELAQQADPSKNSTVVEYINMNITKLDDIMARSELHGAIDKMFMRFVMMHVKVDLYDATIQNLKTLLKPNGKIISEETVWDNIYCNYHQETINEYKSFVLQESIKTNLDYNIGKTIGEIFRKSGFEINEYEVINRKITPNEIVEMFMSIMKILKAKHPGEEQHVMFDRWISVISTISNDTPGIVVRTSGTSVLTCTKP